MSHRAWGVTVLEVVLVVMLLAVLASIAAPRFAGGSVEVSAAANRLASDLRRVRLLALSQGRSLCVGVFNAAAGGYRVTQHDGSVCPVSPPILDPLAGSFEVTLAGVSSLAGPAVGQGFRFRSDGRPNAAASFTITAAGKTATVTVASLTGHVLVQL